MRITLCFLLVSLLLSCNSSKTTADLPFEYLDSYKEVPWVSMSDVEQLVKHEPRKILVDVYTPWCGPCKMMDRNTFTNQKIIDQVGTNFYPVKFNAEGPEEVTFMGKVHANPGYDPARSRSRNARHELASFFSVGGYPCLVVLDENMRIVDKILGYKNPDQLAPELSKHQKLGMLEK